MPKKKYKKPYVGKYKPDCYTCGWRRTIPGDAHSRCAHPVVTFAENDKKLGADMNTFNLLSILAGATKAASLNHPLSQVLNIQANEIGIRGGRFSWPYNFDPTWIEHCLGWTSFMKVCIQCKLSAVCLGGGLDSKPESCSSGTWKWRWRNKRKSSRKNT